MTWLDTSIPVLRTILNDSQCATTQFGDGRLEELLMAAAYLNLTQISFSTDYTVDIVNSTIDPDPDVTFINFMILRAACLADQGTFRTKALSAGILARCGPAVLDTRNYISAFNTLLTEGPCKAFDEVLKQYRFSGNTDVIRAILTPFVSNDFDPSSGFNSFNTHRDRINI